MKRSLLLVLAFSLQPSALVLAAPLTGAQATNAIVGEAAGCPYVVKLGVAEAIRNRQKGGRPQGLRGVYGFNARHNRTETARTWAAAAKAWRASAVTDLTHGATHFGNAADVAKGTFLGMKLTTVLGSGKHTTYFFKPA